MKHRRGYTKIEALDAIDKAKEKVSADEKKKELARRMEAYVDSVAGRHPKLPKKIFNAIKKAETKGQAKRILRDYLRETGV